MRDYKEIATDLAYGVGIIGMIALVITTLFFLGEAINLTKDNVRLILAVPFFGYFTYLFGGLSRDVLNRNK
jgi:hypothetical protein